MNAHPHLAAVIDVLNSKFPYFAKTVDKRVEELGAEWTDDFEDELATFFSGGVGSPYERRDRLRHVCPGCYADVAQDIYLDRQYMFDLYLPGILLSQFL
jgi:hypothetical protein